MNEFEKALCGNVRSGKIPDEHDIFGAEGWKIIAKIEAVRAR
ncbi:hypothetical protein [Treponema sp. OMZ 840]